MDAGVGGRGGSREGVIENREKAKGSFPLAAESRSGREGHFRVDLEPHQAIPWNLMWF